MSSRYGAPDPNDDESYELGDLELAPRPRRSLPEEPELDEELTTVVPSVATALPANDMGLEFARRNEAQSLRESDDDHGFGDPLAGPSLELDLPPDAPLHLRAGSSAPPHRPSQARPSSPTGGAASARPSQATGPSSRAPRPSHHDDELRAARALADYGEPAAGLDAARYAVRVGVRALALHRERREVEQHASVLAESYEQALRDLGRALLDDQAVRSHDALRDRVLLVQTRQGELAQTEQSTRAAQAHEDSALESLAHKRAALEAELEPFSSAERRAADALAKVDAELKRKKAKLQRAEIELRALSRASLPPPPERVQSIELERAQQERELSELASAHAEATASLGRARRELSLHRGGLDDIERQHAQKHSESKARSRGHEEAVARAEHALSAALCALAEAADAVGLAHSAAEQVAGLRAREAALDQVVDQLAAYDRALTQYDRDALLRGCAMWVGLLLALALLIRVL